MSAPDDKIPALLTEAPEQKMKPVDGTYAFELPQSRLQTAALWPLLLNELGDERQGKRINQRRLIHRLAFWTSAWGEDIFGLWVCLDFEGVQQCFRWIEPDEFMMGSPKDEYGRGDSETQHHVVLTQGFWIADTTIPFQRRSRQPGGKSELE